MVFLGVCIQELFVQSDPDKKRFCLLSFIIFFDIVNDTRPSNTGGLLSIQRWTRGYVIIILYPRNSLLIQYSLLTGVISPGTLEQTRKVVHSRVHLSRLILLMWTFKSTSTELESEESKILTLTLFEEKKFNGSDAIRQCRWLYRFCVRLLCPGFSPVLLCPCLTPKSD